MLLGSDAPGGTSLVDRGFKYRNGFLLVAVVAYLIRLLFFPGGIQPKLQFQGDLARYFQLRGGYALLTSTLYFFSYIKGWYFERISLIVTTLAVFGFISDFLAFYLTSFADAALPVSVLVFLRAATLYCLVMNTLRSQRAPPLPRYFLS